MISSHGLATILLAFLCISFIPTALSDGSTLDQFSQLNPSSATDSNDFQSPVERINPYDHFRTVDIRRRRRSANRITIASHNHVVVFLNGKAIRVVKGDFKVSSFSPRLSKGDVITLMTQARGFSYGVVANVIYGHRHHFTGSRAWKVAVVHRHHRRHLAFWMSKRFNSCKWKHPIKRPRRSYSRWLRDFPRAAFPVWAPHAPRRGGTILLRLVVGGENCHHSTASKITFAADNAAWLYINGKLVRSISDWSKIQSLNYVPRKGDVIGIKAVDFGHWFGVIAQIAQGRRHIVTGGSGWKAKPCSRRDTNNPSIWATKRQSSCRWNRPVVRPRPNAIHPGKAPGFPYKFGAKYVWARGSGVKGCVQLRYVIGGEKCTGGSGGHDRATITFSTKRPVHLFVRGRRVRVKKIAHRVYAARVSLNKGAVVAFIAPKVRGGSGGIMADIFFKGVHYRTGAKGWKALRGSAIRGNWLHSNYNACGWPRARGYGGWIHRKGFPVRARFIWARGVSSHGSAGIRFVVGGETCHGKPSPRPSKRPSPRPTAKRAVIALTADNEATLYHNGRRVARVHSWRQVVKTVLHVRTGDVLSAEAFDSGDWFGIKIGLDIGHRKLGTGHGQWKAQAGLSRRLIQSGAWKRRSFKSCKWHRAQVRPRNKQNTIGLTPRFPGLGAELVWAKAAKVGEKAFFRLVVGGESC